MALNPHVSAARRAAMLNTLTTSCNSGILRIYNGSQPADNDAAIGAVTLLSSLTLNATSFGAATSTASTNSVMTANAITSDPSAAASGTATWFRIWQSNGTTPVLDGTVGATSGFDLNLVGSASITVGAVVAVSSLTLTLAV